MAVSQLKHLPHSYASAKAIVEAHAAKRGEHKGEVKLGNNTYLIELDRETYAIRYHSSNIAYYTLKADGLDICLHGWDTYTTRGRVDQILRAWWESKPIFSTYRGNRGYLHLARDRGVSRIRFGIPKGPGYTWDFDSYGVYRFEVARSGVTGYAIPFITESIKGEWLTVKAYPVVN